MPDGRRATWPAPAIAVSKLLEQDSVGGPDAATRPLSAGGCPAGEGDLIPRPLTAEEREGAWRAANYFGAEPCQPEPVALWILGPSSVGKSTLTASVAPRFGIRPRPQAPEPPHSGSAGRQQLDAVIVDGEFMRDAHDVYCRWIKTEDWRSAYPALKSIINKEKDSMCTAAAADRRHMVIPHTMLNLEKGLTEVVQLTCQGYTNHVVAVVAPLEECRRRGAARELETGKRYEPREFRQSLDAIWPMISACNGRFELIRAVEASGEARELEYSTLASGRCHQCAGLPAGAADISEEAISDILFSVAGRGGESAPTSPSRGGGAHFEMRLPGIPDSMRGDPMLTPRLLTDDERFRAWQSANFHGAPSNQEQPVAVWVLGPPCVGKTTLIAQLGQSFDVLEGPEGCGLQVDGVVVDGNYFRESHPVYQQWTSAASPASASSAFKSISDKEKDLLCTKATLCRKNIVLGRRLTDLNKGLTEIEELRWQGYANHVLAVVASFEECERRAQAGGRVFSRREYDASLRAIPAMIAACNGRYAILRPAERQQGSEAPVEFTCCSRGRGTHRGVPTRAPHRLRGCTAPATGAPGDDESDLASATSLAFSSLDSLASAVEEAVALGVS